MRASLWSVQLLLFPFVELGLYFGGFFVALGGYGVSHRFFEFRHAHLFEQPHIAEFPQCF